VRRTPVAAVRFRWPDPCVAGAQEECALTKRSKRKRTSREDLPTLERGRQTHLVADLWKCDADVLCDVDTVRSAMMSAVEVAGGHVVDVSFHRFPGGGVTGFVSIKESHLSIHTWPEEGFAAIDVFMCGEARPERAIQHLVEALGAGKADLHTLDRGNSPPGSQWDTQPERTATIPSMPLVYGLTLVVAMCSIVYELLLAQTLSALLGNTVLRYSVTIGCYLGALGIGAILCGDAGPTPVRRLARIEVGLSAVGGLAVPAFYFLDAWQRVAWMQVPSGAWAETGILVAFLLATHALIVGIGLLSGYEIPLLLALGERRRAGSGNQVLGVDYFGALIGSVAFPLILLRSFGLIASGFVVGLLNAAAALVLIHRPNVRGRLRLAVPCAATVAVLCVGLWQSAPLEQFFLKKFYFLEDVSSIRDLFDTQADRPDIERHRSPYQTVDLMRMPAPEQWVYDLMSDKKRREADYPNDLWLFLDREYQVFSGLDEYYHEWFVHAPIEAGKRLPRRVLVIGGGDGLVLREVLKYDSVERVVHVDIDPTMVRLSETHPTLARMNGHPHRDPRVTLILADAFRWLRRGTELFDAIYVDVPMARDYNLSMLYSREFYSLIRHRLAPHGFMVFDAPDMSCERGTETWSIYRSTLHAAGFRTIVPLRSVYAFDEPRVEQALNEMIGDYVLEARREDGTVVRRLTTEETREHFRRRMAEEVVMQEFILAFPEERTVNTEWWDPGVRLDAFRAAHLPIAFTGDCPDSADPRLVNSVFRPTIPSMELLTIRFP